MEGTLIMMTGLMIFFTLLFTIHIYLISGRIWKPFYQTLRILEKYRLKDPAPALPNTSIDEFVTLNLTITKWLNKIAGDYNRIREYNENASHELQTHLSVIRANAEALLNDSSDKPTDPEQIRNILSTTIRLSQAQKSLLLLSKIGNMEFSNHELIDLKPVTLNILDYYNESIALRNIRVEENLDSCLIQMDPGLAEILVNNLIKNAVKHNIPDGYIRISLNLKELTVGNSGHPFHGDPSELLGRFIKGEKGNMGIGLAIVHQICLLYHFEIHYSVSEITTHAVKISFLQSKI
jgi:signal transduction histidine kinase